MDVHRESKNTEIGEACKDEVETTTVDRTPPEASPNSITRKRILLASIALGLVAILSALAWFAKSHVGEATFRLVANTEFVSMLVKSRLSLHLESRKWQIEGIDQVILDDGSVWRGAILTIDANPVVKRPDGSTTKIAMSTDAPANDELVGLTVRRFPGVVSSFRVEIAGARAKVDIGIPDGIKLQLIDNRNARQRLPPARTLVVMLKPSARIEFEIGKHEEIMLDRGFRVRKLTFARENDDLEASDASSTIPDLIDGSLQFMEGGQSDIKLYRGTDVRFSKTDTAVSALLLTNTAIQVVATGKTKDATLYFGFDAISLMPTRLAAIENLPETSLILGLLSAISASLALFLHFTQTHGHIRKMFSTKDKGRS